MIDTLVAMEPRFSALGQAGRIGVEPRRYLLVTLHRPALVDGPLLEQVLTQLEAVARELPVVFPAHPRTLKMIGERALSAGLHVLGLDPARIADILPALFADVGPAPERPPGWDGHAAERVADVVCQQSPGGAARPVLPSWRLRTASRSSHSAPTSVIHPTASDSSSGMNW